MLHPNLLDRCDMVIRHLWINKGSPNIPYYSRRIEKRKAICTDEQGLRGMLLLAAIPEIWALCFEMRIQILISTHL